MKKDDIFGYKKYSRTFKIITNYSSSLSDLEFCNVSNLEEKYI